MFVRLLGPAVAAVLAVGLTVPAAGAAATSPDGPTGTSQDPGAGTPAPTRLDLVLPTPRRADVSVPAVATAVDEGGAPVGGVVLVLERRDAAGPWGEAGRATTGSDGTISVPVVVGRDPATNRFRARTVDTGVTSAVVVVELTPRATSLRGQPSVQVVDGRAVRLTWTLVAGNGTVVPDATVRVVRRERGRRVSLQTLTTDSAGRVAVRVRPRYDGRAWAKALPGDWYDGSVSAATLIDNRPAGPVVRLPRNAPRPKLQVPAQPRAFAAGPNPRVSRIPTKVWTQMVGRTWHRGCPVGRRGLRLIRVNYWGYDGYAHRGEIVVNRSTANTVASTFADIYRSRLPLRSMYRVDRFGYSSRVGGGDDFASMDAGNTSGFNCRRVVNYSALSPHAYGFAIDINTWENPYRSRTGIVPNTYWQYHSHPLVAWRSTSHPMVQTLFRHGWSWPYGLGDTQHFSAPASGRWALAARRAERIEHALEHGFALD